jgi:phosphoribosylformylglycinamidine synthase
MQGVVAGVRDYGNRMGIPTVNGAILFDERYLANPLVFCGTVGTIPHDKAFKKVIAGDLIVAVGRTHRARRHPRGDVLEPGADARVGDGERRGGADRQRDHREEGGRRDPRGPRPRAVHRDHRLRGRRVLVGGRRDGRRTRRDSRTRKGPAEVRGLSYTEIWISESQERMVLSVPPEKWTSCGRCAKVEDVEAAVLGTFEASGRLKLSYQGNVVADLDMHFLHDGRPTVVKSAEWAPVPVGPAQVQGPQSLGAAAPQDVLLAILSHPSVCSKEWVIRQYDHEVQGGSVIKPLVGVANDGPSDASVVMPVLGSWVGAAVGCGINPRLADLDPYAAAGCAIDEAVRNVVAVGADPARVAILDNFCWGNIHDPKVLERWSAPRRRAATSRSPTAPRSSAARTA